MIFPCSKGSSNSRSKCSFFIKVGHYIALSTSYKLSKFQVSSIKESGDIAFGNNLVLDLRKMGMVSKMGVAPLEFEESF